MNSKKEKSGKIREAATRFEIWLPVLASFGLTVILWASHGKAETVVLAFMPVCFSFAAQVHFRLHSRIKILEDALKNRSGQASPVTVER